MNTGVGQPEDRLVDLLRRVVAALHVGQVEREERSMRPNDKMYTKGISVAF